MGRGAIKTLNKSLLSSYYGPFFPTENIAVNESDEISALTEHNLGGKRKQHWLSTFRSVVTSQWSVGPERLVTAASDSDMY